MANPNDKPVPIASEETSAAAATAATDLAKAEDKLATDKADAALDKALTADDKAFSGLGALLNLFYEMFKSEMDSARPLGSLLGGIKDGVGKLLEMRKDAKAATDEYKANESGLAGDTASKEALTDYAKEEGLLEDALEFKKASTPERAALKAKWAAAAEAEAAAAAAAAAAVEAAKAAGEDPVFLADMDKDIKAAEAAEAADKAAKAAPVVDEPPDVAAGAAAVDEASPEAGPAVLDADGDEPVVALAHLPNADGKLVESDLDPLAGGPDHEAPDHEGPDHEVHEAPKA